MQKKTFILGVGCQKGGTTWLYSQLKKSNKVDMGFGKEYHIFDTLYVEECQWRLNQEIQSLEKISNKHNLFNADPNLFMWLDFYRDTNKYFDYFNYLYLKDSNINAVGDITPSYSALPIEAFKHIKEGLLSRGFDIKVVFLMRDPFERCWSALRMRRRNILRRKPSHKFLKTEEEELLIFYKKRDCILRTQYEATIYNLESVFTSDQIFYGVYEELFTEETLSKLGVFLDLEDFSPNIYEKSNVSEKKNIVSEDIMTELVQFYSPTYKFCDERFHIKDKGIWKGFQYI